MNGNRGQRRTDIAPSTCAWARTGQRDRSQMCEAGRTLQQTPTWAHREHGSSSYMRVADRPPLSRRPRGREPMTRARSHTCESRAPPSHETHRLAEDGCAALTCTRNLAHVRDVET